MITVSIAVDDDDNLYLYRVPFTCRPMYGGLAFAGWCCASQPCLVDRHAAAAHEMDAKYENCRGASLPRARASTMRATIEIGGDLIGSA